MPSRKGAGSSPALRSIKKEVDLVPIYEFQCDNCDHIGEYLVTSSEEKERVTKRGILLRCGDCGKLGIKKPLMPLSNFRMTGFEKG